MMKRVPGYNRRCKRKHCVRCRKSGREMILLRCKRIQSVERVLSAPLHVELIRCDGGDRLISMTERVPM